MAIRFEAFRLYDSNMTMNSHITCGLIRSSALKATPNIDLQFATASSLVKIGNRNLSEAILNENTGTPQ